MSHSDKIVTDMDTFASALWYVAPGRCELRSEPLANPSGDLVRVRTKASGVSRGTERLVSRGHVPESEWSRMRAPFQQGDFPFPVKYGYSLAGVIEDGPDSDIGARVFCLHPHQTAFVIARQHLIQIPKHVPFERAVLAANMETALNALWDGMPSPGDHICVVGGGVVGLLTAYLAARIPATMVTVIDINPQRRSIVEALGCGFATPDTLPFDQDLVFHTSVSAEGLKSALKVAGDGATIIEMSWYGDKPVPVMLGADFHSRRLVLKSSQVGNIRPERQARWSYKRRLETAMSLLTDPVFDRLISHEIAFKDAPDKLPELFEDNAALTPILTYD